MHVLLFRALGLLGLAILVALAARRLRLPYTVGLVLAGAALALFRVDAGLALTHDLIFDVVLPPLLFEAALNLRWKELRRDLAPVVALATVGVALCAALVAWGLGRWLAWPAESALAFGALIAATDPIAVIALLRESGVTGRLRLLIEAESLVNDGAAAVLFTLVLVWAAHDSAASGGPFAAAYCVPVHRRRRIADRRRGRGRRGARRRDLGRSPGRNRADGGRRLRLVSRGGAPACLGRARDGRGRRRHGQSRRARPEDRFGRPLSAHGRTFVLEFWEFAAFLANSLVFLLMGSAMASVDFSREGWKALAIAVGLALAGRAVAVYPVCLAFSRSRWAIPLKEQHLLWWGGLRGALALALALSLPADMPRREDILIVAFAVVAFSVVVQGLTAPFALRALGLAKGRA